MQSTVCLPTSQFSFKDSFRFGQYKKEKKRKEEKKKDKDKKRRK